MGREEVKREILRLLTGHDGQWSWYEIDRAMSSSGLHVAGPFNHELQELLAEGLVELRPNQAVPAQPRYWLTEQERQAARLSTKG